MVIKKLKYLHVDDNAMLRSDAAASHARVRGPPTSCLV